MVAAGFSPRHIAQPNPAPRGTAATLMIALIALKNQDFTLAQPGRSPRVTRAQPSCDQGKALV